MYVWKIYVWVCVLGIAPELTRAIKLSNKRVQICVLCEPDILAIQKLTHEMIPRSELVRAVKTRQWFGSKTVSFHVSVYFCIIAIFPLWVNVSFISINYTVLLIMVMFRYCSFMLGTVYDHANFGNFSISE